MEYTVCEIAEILGISEYTKNLSGHILLHPEVDSRHIIDPDTTLFFACKGNLTDGHYFIPELIEKGVKAFVVQELPQNQPESVCFFQVSDTITALQQLAIYHRSCFQIPVIGITGSNGKTIVKEWLSLILQNKYTVCKNPKSFNSQLGVALSVLELNKDHQIAIFEAGISKKDEMKNLERMIQPNLGIFTNIGDAHQAGFSGMDEKTREKLILFEHVSKLIYCRDYESIAYHRKHFDGNIEWSFKENSLYNVKRSLRNGGICQLQISKKNIDVTYNLNFYDEASVENVIHCIIISMELGLTSELIQSGLQQLHSLPMRMEQKEGINGCILINDSYSLDLKSFQLALQFVDQQNHFLPRTIILTDFADQKNLTNLWKSVADLLHKYKFSKLIAIGKSILDIQKLLPENIKFSYFESTANLLENLDSLFLKNELILVKGARKFKLEGVFHSLSVSRHDTILEIDLKAIKHNVQVYRSLLNTDVGIMAVVKAAAYGSGHYEIAKLLEHIQVDYLSVAYPDEGILLRQKGIQTAIMVMNIGSVDFSTLMEYNLEPEIYSLNQIKRLIFEIEKSKKIRIHLKLDTGMHRLGFLEEDLDELIHILISNPLIEVQSIFTHLAGSDAAPFDEFTKDQAKLFDVLSGKIISHLKYKPLLHVLNSGGLARHPELQYNMIRLGIGMYGIESDPILVKKLEKVHTLKTKISQLKWLDAGETISYNRSVKLNSKSLIAVLSLGYADGLPRNAGIKGYALWSERHKLPLMGLVCMDMCMADVTTIPEIQEGTEVEVFGKNAAIEELAKAVDSIPYEILCRISPRVKRVYLQD
jgi:Alr-MurF fusion protein